MRGHLVKRGKNSWTIVLSLPGQEGRRRQKWVAVRGNRREAESRLAELVHQVDTGGYVGTPARLTLGAFLERWLQDYAATQVRPRTMEGYTTVIKRHLVPCLGSIPLQQFQPAHLQVYYADRLARGRQDIRRGEPLSARTVLSHHRVLREALGHAVKWGLVGRNVALAVRPSQGGQEGDAYL